MRILHLTPGTGTFHCGSCLRDNALIKALRVRGHDVVMAPLYMPLVTDREAASPEQPIRVGGISLYLQQKISWFHRMPKFVHNWVNHPMLLRMASKRLGMTSAKSLGEMTLGSLLGEDGRQWGEWKKLLSWIKNEFKPDVVSLSNSLLSGLAGAISRDVGVPVVCSMQGEDSFLDTLPDDYRDRAWAAMRHNARSLAAIIAPSRFYADAMAKRLELEPDQIHVVSNGIDTAPFPIAECDPNWPVIGYLARMIPGKGLTTLVDAFIELSRRGNLPRVKLKIAGSMMPSDEPYVNELREKLKEAGCAGKVEFLPNLTFTEKLKFLSGISVFSVPATYGEAFGLYVIEAIACGIPVVQPDSGAFGELIQATQGGVLCAPDDVGSLADSLEGLLQNEEQRDQLANRGMANVRRDFTSAKMAERFDAVLQRVKTAA
ncbi:MAG: glycosyltransferase family 4 protein [Verrucomicrobiales bacterium]|nr:glycosyltransferase family 4 protein [Verrucomicrobiales bacterium]MCP5560719.1 glycosyltransferase family 4 protein [Verrucomicrobiaceae bacterium]